MYASDTHHMSRSKENYNTQSAHSAQPRLNSSIKQAFREGVLISPQSLFDYLHVTRLREINTLSLLKNNLGYSLSGQA